MYFKFTYKVLADINDAGIEAAEYMNADNLEMAKTFFFGNYLLGEASQHTENGKYLSLNGFFIEKIVITEVPKEEVEVSITLTYADFLKNEKDLSELVRTKINEAIETIDLRG